MDRDTEAAHVGAVKVARERLLELLEPWERTLPRGEGVGFEAEADRVAKAHEDRSPEVLEALQLFQHAVNQAWTYATGEAGIGSAIVSMWLRRNKRARDVFSRDELEAEAVFAVRAGLVGLSDPERPILSAVRKAVMLHLDAYLGRALSPLGGLSVQEARSCRTASIDTLIFNDENGDCG